MSIGERDRLRVQGQTQWRDHEDRGGGPQDRPTIQDRTLLILKLHDIVLLSFAHKWSYLISLVLPDKTSSKS